MAPELTIDGPIDAARLRMTAHGSFEAFINGALVSDHELSPGFTSSGTRLQVHSVDRMLRVGL